MKELADISQFENLQVNAHRNMSDMSVFNMMFLPVFEADSLRSIKLSDDFYIRKLMKLPKKKLQELSKTVWSAWDDAEQKAFDTKDADAIEESARLKYIAQMVDRVIKPGRVPRSDDQLNREWRENMGDY